MDSMDAAIEVSLSPSHAGSGQAGMGVGTVQIIALTCRSNCNIYTPRPALCTKLSTLLKQTTSSYTADGDTPMIGLQAPAQPMKLTRSTTCGIIASMYASTTALSMEFAIRAFAYAMKGIMV
jgi:hypothetical protein